MHFGSRTRLLFAVNVSFILFQHVLGTSTCYPLNSRNSRHFDAFESLRPTNKHANGCTSYATVAGGRNSRDIYQENHIINVESDRAADIYLNINGIHRRTRKSLPHYKEYKYEFALFSKKDVIWLVSEENLPQSSVTIKFYLLAGSHVIFRDGGKAKTVKLDYDDMEHMSSYDILNWCRSRGIFSGITSFTEISKSEVAKLNVAVGNKQGASFEGSFTSCSTLTTNYTSPIVTVEYYKKKQPLLVFEPKTSVEDKPVEDKAFVVDFVSESPSEGRMPIINLEIVGAEESVGSSNAKTIVVLRSRGSVQWNAHVERGLHAKNILFVVSKHSKVTTDESLGNVAIRYEDMDYGENNQTILSNAIVAINGTTVVSYSQYDSGTNLIFLKLTAAEDRSQTGFSGDHDSLQDKAHDIYRQSETNCDETNSWSINVPKKILKQYDLTEEDMKFQSGSSVCVPMETSSSWFYGLTDCSSHSDDGTQSVDMEVIFKVKSPNHMFTAPALRSESITVPLKGCHKTKTDIPEEPVAPRGFENIGGSVENITSSCTTGLFIVKIPNTMLGDLDLSTFAKCKNRTISERTEFTLRDELANCGAYFQTGVATIEIPKKQNVDGTIPGPVKVSCSYSTEEVTVNYDMTVFEDFNLRTPLTKTIQVKKLAEDTDETTFHFQVFAASNDPTLTVFLSRCSLKKGVGETQLIKNNCPANDAVSFVRTKSKISNHTQHFVVKMRGFFTETIRQQKIECEVSACALEPCDHCIPSVPQCMYLHGDACTESSVKRSVIIAPYHQSTISSPYFKLSPDLISTKALGPNGVDKAKGKTVTPRNAEPETATDATTLIALTLAAFVLGCIFIGILVVIHKRYPRKPISAKAWSTRPTKSESDGSASSGASKSTRSTKTTISSFSCFKTARASSTSSSKDDLEMEREKFLNNPTSATTPPHVLEDEILSCNNSPHGVEGRVANDESSPYTIPCQTKSSGSDRKSVHGARMAKQSEDIDVHIPHKQTALMLKTQHTSQEHNDLPSMTAASHSLTQGTSCETLNHRHTNGALSGPPVTNDDWRVYSASLQVTEDEFARLKEVAL